MSGWDNETGGGDWKDDDEGAAADTWNDIGSAANGGGNDDGFASGADADGGAATTNGNADGGDIKCRRCGESGHMARQCPTAPEGSGNDGKCFNCGEEGHSKADCTNPRVSRAFTGTCRKCEKEGHMAADCPNAPQPACFNCKQAGHATAECRSKRVFDDDEIAAIDAESAWDELVKADGERDLDDFRLAFKVYVKAVPDVNFVELEQSFRNNNFNVHIIALEKELPKTFTYVNLQGDLDQKYFVGFHLSAMPKRKTQADSWPENAEENLERLKDAGFPLERGIPKCIRCNELGHTTRGCPEEATENPEKVEVKCANCEKVGHRVRDCPIARPDKFACRNCKQSGHKSMECPEPRSAENVECRKCNEVGHFSKDCPSGGGNACRNCGKEGHMSKECQEPRNLDNVTCRNCEKTGHLSKTCPEPRDYSKVQCTNCNEMGHTKVRCKQPVAEANGDFADDADTGGGGFDATPATAPAAEGGDDWGGATTGNGDDAWAHGPAASPPVAAGGDGDGDGW